VGARGSFPGCKVAGA